jgi:hypothetical protein
MHRTIGFMICLCISHNFDGYKTLKDDTNQFPRPGPTEAPHYYSIGRNPVRDEDCSHHGTAQRVSSTCSDSRSWAAWPGEKQTIPHQGRLDHKSDGGMPLSEEEPLEISSISDVPLRMTRPLPTRFWMIERHPFKIVLSTNPIGIVLSTAPIAHPLSRDAAARYFTGAPIYTTWHGSVEETPPHLQSRARFG